MRLTKHQQNTPVRKGSTRRHNPSALSDFELFELLVDGTDIASIRSTAHQLQYFMRKGIENITYDTLVDLPGVSPRIANSIVASLELAKRHHLRDVEPLRSQHDILTRLIDLRTQLQEVFVCLSLDGGQRLIAQRTITIGTLDTVLAHPREVFADPIADRAACVIVAHNHPSGDPTPSEIDVRLTQQLVASGQLLGIPLRDHIIVSNAASYSFRQHHLL